MMKIASVAILLLIISTWVTTAAETKNPAPQEAERAKEHKAKLGRLLSHP